MLKRNTRASVCHCSHEVCSKKESVERIMCTRPCTRTGVHTLAGFASVQNKNENTIEEKNRKTLVPFFSFLVLLVSCFVDFILQRAMRSWCSARPFSRCVDLSVLSAVHTSARKSVQVQHMALQHTTYFSGGFGEIIIAARLFWSPRRVGVKKRFFFFLVTFVHVRRQSALGRLSRISVIISFRHDESRIARVAQILVHTGVHHSSSIFLPGTKTHDTVLQAVPKFCLFIYPYTFRA